VEGEGRTAPCRQHARDDRGQVVVLFALLLPVLMLLGSVVVAVGSWYTHARHLQTKVDAAAFAGGGVWGFPCGDDVDANIEAEARLYLGEHTAADGAVVASPHNEMLGGVRADQVFATLNQADWWRGSFSASDFSSPAGSVCASKVLDVKATEADSPLLWSWLPLFPDIKRKARVQIEEIAGLTGLLPIAVRLPQPLSAAAVFFDEAGAEREILAVVPFRQVCTESEPTCIWGAPAGLGQWTTEPKAGSGGSWARLAARPKTGIVVATSVRPLCGAGTPPAGQPCMNMSPTPSWVGRSVDEFCQQGNNTVRCYDDVDGGGPSQIVSEGLHFLYGHATGTTPAGPNWPELRGAWLEAGPLAAGTTCPSPYFVSEPATCTVELNVRLDAGSCMRGAAACFDDPATSPEIETRTTTSPSGTNIEAKYCVVRTGQTGPDACVGQFTTAEEMTCTGSTGNVTCASQAGKHPQIAPGSRGNAFAIQIRLRNTAVTGFPDCRLDEFRDTCRFFLTGNGFAGTSVLPSAEEVLAEPVHRVFSGDLERTTPVEWLRLTVDLDCDPLTLTDLVIGHDYTGSDADAANQPTTPDRCYVLDLGVAGGLARDQDEVPIAFNLGDNSSQRAYVDCDPNLANMKSEIVTGCQWPPYAANTFASTPYCPGTAGFFDLANPPLAGWPPYRCVLTQTGNSSQVIQGFNERIFGVANNPRCPSDDAAEHVVGRNYWHRHNNDYDEETFAWDGTGSGGPGDPDGDDKGNTLRSDDPRLVTLFFTTYESFTDTGNEVYPIVGFGNFYVTGYGEVVNGNWKGGGPEDPCAEGSSLAVGAGNAPPADIDMSKNTRWVWGHFVKNVTPAPFTTGGSGVLCNPEASFQPCVAVLVE